MVQCPHCSEQGITAWNKISSGLIAPAQCKKCEKSSGVSGKTRGLTSVFYYCCFFATLWWAFVRWDYIPFLCFMAVVFVTELLVLRFAPLVPYSDEQVRKSKKNTAIIALGVILIVVVAGMFFK